MAIEKPKEFTAEERYLVRRRGLLKAVAVLGHVIIATGADKDNDPDSAVIYAMAKSALADITV